MEQEHGHALEPMSPRMQLQPLAPFEKCVINQIGRHKIKIVCERYYV